MAKKKPAQSLGDMPMMSRKSPKATIQKAANGYIVTDQYGTRPAAAKTLIKAQKIQEKYLK